MNTTEAQESKVIIESTDGSQTVIDVLDSDNVGNGLDTSQGDTGLDLKSTVIGSIITIVVGGIVIVIKKVFNWGKDKKAKKEAEKAEMEEFRKFQAEQAAKAKVDAVEVPAPAEEIKPEEETVEVKTEEKKPQKTK